MKAIDPIMIKQAIKDGQLEVYKSKGSVYIRDAECGDCICIWRGDKDEYSD